MLFAPVPVSATESGVGLPLVFMLHVALSLFDVDGVKVIFAAQLVDAARLPPHVVDVTTKSAALVPETAPALSVTELGSALVTVIVCAELEEPSFTEPKDRLLGDTVTAPPVPDRATVSGVGLPLLVIVHVALSFEAVEGVKVTFTVQLEEAAMLEPHVVEAVAKSAA